MGARERRQGTRMGKSRGERQRVTPIPQPLIGMAKQPTAPRTGAFVRRPPDNAARS